ncbi:MAG: signal peptidase I [Oscillibacter sp.]|nr:signal peptidase I [Oscillibacter sp.]
MRKEKATAARPSEEKASPMHKVLTVIGTILCVILIPILIINVTLIVKSYTNKEAVPDVGGYFPLIVLTDSMYPEIESGDLIICHTVEPEEVAVGDVISFFDPAGNGTSIVTHRVVEIVDEGGALMFRTRGDNNNTDDKVLVGAQDIVGTYQNRIGGAGNIALFMQTTTGLIVCVVLPIILLVGYDIIRRRIYEKNKQDDTDALLAELEALRAEKAQKEVAAANADKQE